MIYHAGMSEVASASAVRGSAWHVFQVFLKLGVTSFGGPIAHLGYFRAEVVERRRWMTDRQYAELVALCQFLPGPASSQVGFGIGLQRAGVLGALAAFVAFTLPSAMLMVGFAYGASLFEGPVGEGLLSGLKIVAVAIIAQAVLGMAKTLTPDRQRATIAVITAVVALVFAGSLGQIAAIVLGVIGGYLFCRNRAETDTEGAAGADALRFSVRKSVGIVGLTLFAGLLIAGPAVALATDDATVTLFDAFYRSGAFVFGGGHVVLPLLQAATVDSGWVAGEDFLAGYGMAQAVPGPLFTFAAFLGASSSLGPGGVLGAVVSLVAIFLPGFLLLVGVLPFWNAVRARAWAQAAMRGANAAVVGILAAALYMPVFATAVTGPGAFALALVCFLLLVVWKLPPWVVVLFAGVGGAGLTLFV